MKVWMHARVPCALPLWLSQSFDAYLWPPEKVDTRFT